MATATKRQKRMTVLVAAGPRNGTVGIPVRHTKACTQLITEAKLTVWVKADHCVTGNYVWW